MRKLHYLFFVLLFFIFINNTTIVKAETDDKFIRVGLESLYKNKSKIDIETTKIGLGYSYDNNFTEEIVINSETGFELTSATGFKIIH